MKSYLYDFIKNRDKFGRRITLTHDGKASFTTAFGGIITMLIYILITGVSIFSFIRMIERSSIQTNQTRSFINLYDKDANLEYNLSESNLEFSIGIILPPHLDPSLTPSFFSIAARWDDNTVENDGVNPITNVFLDECANDTFDQFLGENGLDSFPKAKYYCSTNQEFVLKSNNGTFQK